MAALFGVRQPTVRRWLADGKLAFIRTPGGQIRVPGDAFQLKWEKYVNEGER